MQFDHIAWRSERANVHDKERPVTVEIEEAAGALTIIGRAPSARQAFDLVVGEAARRGLPIDALPDRTDMRQGIEPLDMWCAVTYA